MSNVDAVVKEILGLTSSMIEVGLCVEPNYPSQTKHVSDDGAVEDVSISGLAEASIALRNRPYTETYNTLRTKRAFNMRLIDGALLQFRYRFKEGVLIKHVLSFYPSPDLLEYQNDPEIYEMDILYAEVVMKDIVTTPIRFDFDMAASEDYVHPASHFTIGQYKNCRMPVLGALTPYRFMNFVLRAFYNTSYHEFCAEWRGSVPDFANTVTDRERRDLHWSYS